MTPQAGREPGRRLGRASWRPRPAQVCPAALSDLFDFDSILIYIPEHTAIISRSLRRRGNLALIPAFVSALLCRGSANIWQQLDHG